MPNFSIGVDLGGTNLRIAAVNQQGDLMEKVTLGTRVALGKDHVIGEMCDAIRVSCRQVSRSSAALQGIGIGVPGHYRHEDGDVARVPQSPGMGGNSGASRNRATPGHACDSGERCQRRCAGREVAGRGARRGRHGHADARHGRRRRNRAQGPHLARHDRNGGRVWPHDGGT